MFQWWFSISLIYYSIIPISLHYLFGIVLWGRVVTSPFFSQSLVYEYGWVAIRFILWVIIQHYDVFYCSAGSCFGHRGLLVDSSTVSKCLCLSFFFFFKALLVFTSLAPQKILKSHLRFPWVSSRISHFSKVLWFASFEMVLKMKILALGLLGVAGMLQFLGSSRVAHKTELRNICT